MTVSLDTKKADGKSILELIGLCAPSGSKLIVETNGPDAETAIQALVDVLKISLAEDISDPPSPQKG